MKFHAMPIDPESRGLNLRRIGSENELWTIRLDQMAYGARVHVTHIDWPMEYTTDYCCGSDPLAQAIIMGVIQAILELHPESVRPGQLCDSWPEFVKKPLCNDPRCWSELCKMAGLDAPLPLPQTDRDLSPYAEVDYQHKLVEAGLPPYEQPPNEPLSLDTVTEQ